MSSDHSIFSMAPPPQASPSAGPPAAFWAAKLGLLAAGAASLVAIARLAFPPLVRLLSSGIPALWAAFRVWLVPPYLFLTVHLIILLIWKLSDRKHHPNHLVVPPPPEEAEAEDPFKPGKELGPPPLVHLPRKPTPELWGNFSPEAEAAAFSGPSPSDDSCVTAEADEESTASSRVDVKKSVKPPPDSIKLEKEEVAAADGDSGVAEGDPGFSLDATWKAIMERSLRPSAVSPTRARDESAGADEMNRRFDDFIKKNRDQIRLQTEEWDQSHHLGNPNLATH